MANEIAHYWLLEVLGVVDVVECCWSYYFAQWEVKVIHSIPLEQGFPSGLAQYEKELYACTSVYGLLTFSAAGKRVNKFPTPALNHPEGIEIDWVKKEMFVMDQKNMSVLNLEKKVLRSWPLPCSGLHRALKLDNSRTNSSDRVFVTLGAEEDGHYVYVYTREGQLLQKFGNELPSKTEGEFHDPRGLTVDDERLYVVDRSNSRVQVFKKDLEKDSFVTSWGQENLIFPVSITRPEEEAGGHVLYVGDAMSVHIFDLTGYLLQRIGAIPRMADDESPYQPIEFRCVYSMVLFRDHLYIADCGNHRVKIFRKEVCY